MSIDFSVNLKYCGCVPAIWFAVDLKYRVNSDQECRLTMILIFNREGRIRHGSHGLSGGVLIHHEPV